MSRQDQVQDALRATDRGDDQPCLGCASSAACADLRLACARYRSWVQTGLSNRALSTEPSRRNYLRVFAGSDDG